jgi:hypothetical protein
LTLPFLYGEDDTADVFDAPGETQIVVEAVCNHRSRHVRLVEIAGRRIAGAGERAPLPERNSAGLEINADLAAKDDPFEGIKSGSRRQA